MKELEDIIRYAMAHMDRTIQEGTEIYEYVEEQLSIFPIGLLPLEMREGYLFLSDGKERDTRVYRYRLSIFEKHDEKYRSVRTEFVADWQRNLVNTYENIKAELIRNRSDLPNPAVYGIETGLTVPVDETLLPIARRMLAKYIQ